MIRRLPFRLGRAPVVVGGAGSQVRLEGPDEMAEAATHGRVAVVAQWSARERLSRSVEELIRQLTEHAYHIVLVSTAEVAAPVAWSGSRPLTVTVLRRPNLGYDFGSWATALDRYPRIAAADCVLFVNDSLAGPFAVLDGLLEQFQGSRADVWGITDTTQFGYHLQSYCLGFRRGCLQEPPLRRFWRDIRVERSKEDVIWRNEIGFSRLLRRERFVTEAAIPYRTVVADGENPTIVGWHKLLDRGFPFVKRTLLERPEVASDGELVDPELRRRFGVDVREWV